MSRPLGSAASLIVGPLVMFLAVLLLGGCGKFPQTVPSDLPAPLQRAKVYLAAGDYRHAVEACQQEIALRPSAESYTYLTYVYQALDAYTDFLARTDQWVAMEHLYLNLSAARTEDWLDPPDVLARIAKEVIQSAAQKQSDVTGALAMRLDSAVTERVWLQQAAWRKLHRDGWWLGVPPDWPW